MKQSRLERVSLFIAVGLLGSLALAVADCPPAPAGYILKANQNWGLDPKSTSSGGQVAGADAAQNFCSNSRTCIAWNNFGYYLTGSMEGVSWSPYGTLCSYVKEVPGWACNPSATGGPEVDPGCPTANCKPMQANLGGELLVLSATSMSAPGHYGRMNGDTAGRCCAECLSTFGCNSWVFCNKPEGCGEPGSCTAWVNSQPKLPDTRTYGYDLTKGPVTNMGGQQRCNADGTWPYTMCSLKLNRNASKLPIYGTGDAAKGWVSGFLSTKVVPPPRPKDCPASLSDYTCSKCATTQAPAKCNRCMQSGQSLQTCSSCTQLTSAKAQDTCLACYSAGLSSYQASTGCGACLITKKDSQGNVLLDGSASPVLEQAASAECFACVNTMGPGAYGSSACFNCYKPIVTNRTACLSCATSKRSRPVAAEGCAYCYQSYVATAGYQGRCLTCLSALNRTSARPDDCSKCAYSGLDVISPGTVDRCFNCMATPGPGGKSYYCNQGIAAGRDVALAPALVVDYFNCLNRGAQPSACQNCGMVGSDSIAQRKTCFGSLKASQA